MNTDEPEETEQIEEEVDQEGDPAVETFEIESYGLDYDARGLAHRFIDNEITVPFYQRSEVWGNAMKSKLIESLLIGIPVPGVFLSKNIKTGQLDVIDGRQRLSALRDFYSDQFALSGKSIQEGLKGKKYSTLLPEEKRKLDNSMVHATIVKQLSPGGNSGIIQIFKRLNEKPTPLTDQEIRTSIFSGDFCQLLDECNKDTNWRTIWGTEKLHNRLKDQEMVLRFFAFKYHFKNYKRPMSAFLDDFIEKNCDLALVPKEELEKCFYPTVKFIVEHLNKPFRLPNKAGNFLFKVSLFDAAIVGISSGLENGYCNKDNINDLYTAYLDSQGYRYGTEEFTNDQERIEARLNAAKKVFADIS